MLRCGAFLMWLAVSSAAGAALPDESFFSRVPGAANAILAMDVQGAFTSPLGRKDGWSKRYIETQNATLTSLPPSVETVLIATQFDFGEMRPVWELGILKSSFIIPLVNVAAAEGTTMTKVAERLSVLSPRNAIFTAFGDKQLAVFAPADRQAYARWVRGLTSNTLPGPSSYLRQAVTGNAGATMVMAIDLGDAVDVAHAKVALAGCKSFVANNLDAAAYSKLLAEVRGFALRMDVKDAVAARLQIDFTEDIGACAPHLPAIVHELIAGAGATIDDMDAWKATVAGKALIMEGPIALASVSRLMSLFELPGGEHHTDVGGGSSVPSTAGATVRYWKAMQQIIAELKSIKPRLEDEEGYKRYAMWYDTYAKKIDQLPALYVDPGLLAFGGKVAGGFRAIATSLRGVPIKTQAEQAGAYMYVSGYSSGRGRWRSSGVTGVDTNLPEVRKQQNKVIADDASARDGVWKQIDDGLATMKRTLAEKYGVAF